MNEHEDEREATPVRLTTRPLWRLRLVGELQRYLLCAAAVAGIAASARFALAPPAPINRPAPAAVTRNVSGAAFAVLFARRYLTWSARAPQSSTSGLANVAGGALEDGAGFSPPDSGSQHVAWAEVAAERELAPELWVFTVVADTDAAGLVYLAVPVARTAAGLRLDGYPAFVGAPAAAPAQLPTDTPEVTEPALQAVVSRALRNYLAGAGGELAADLAAGAEVSLPPLALTLETVQRLSWSPTHGTVVAVVQAQDARGAQYTLGYELEVVAQQQRWEIRAIETNPFA